MGIDRTVNWLDLPDELLLVIATKLIRIKDYVRFRAVCVQWRSFYSKNKKQLRRQVPVIMHPTEDARYGHFYSLPEKRLYKSQVKIHDITRCCNSSEGWVVTLPILRLVHLVNPFLSVENKIELPPLTNLTKRYGSDRNFLQKVVLSKNPTIGTLDYTVMAITGGSWCGCLVMLKPADNEWTYLNTSRSCSYGKSMSDVIYYNDRFYCVNCKGDVFICDDESMILSKVVAGPLGIHTAFTRDYLVESSGDLLLVVRTYDGERDFLAFKLNQRQNEWTIIETLGGRALFLDDTNLISVLASDLHGCKQNRIYYFEKGLDRFEMKVFNIEDGSSRVEYTMPPKVTWPSPVWIQPTL